MEFPIWNRENDTDFLLDNPAGRGRNKKMKARNRIPSGGEPKTKHTRFCKEERFFPSRRDEQRRGGKARAAGSCYFFGKPSVNYSAIRKKFTSSEGKKRGARLVLLAIYDERCAREEFTSNVRACVHMYNYFPA